MYTASISPTATECGAPSKVFEIYDYTIASPWEHLISAAESAIRRSPLLVSLVQISAMSLSSLLPWLPYCSVTLTVGAGAGEFRCQRSPRTRGATLMCTVKWGLACDPDVLSPRAGPRVHADRLQIRSRGRPAVGRCARLGMRCEIDPRTLSPPQGVVARLLHQLLRSDQDFDRSAHLITRHIVPRPKSQRAPPQACAMAGGLACETSLCCGPSTRTWCVLQPDHARPPVVTAVLPRWIPTKLRCS